MGTQTGTVALWELGSRERIMEKPFKVWEPSQLSPQLQAVLAKDQSVTVYRVTWEPNGQLFGECQIPGVLTNTCIQM